MKQRDYLRMFASLATMISIRERIKVIEECRLYVAKSDAVWASPETLAAWADLADYLEGTIPASLDPRRAA